MKTKYAELHDQLGLTHQEAADMLGTSVATVTCWKSGKTKREPVAAILVLEMLIEKGNL